MRVFLKIVLSVILVFLIIPSCRIQKGFEALDIYNYFEAKKQFEKGLKKNPAPASYGLSIIFFRNDNPFHNIDSAYHYALKSIERLEDAQPKKREKWKENFNFTKSLIISHREEVSAQMFKIAKEENKIAAYIDFQARHPWSPLADSAQFFEEELAFRHAQNVSSSSAYQTFLRKYPDTRFQNQAEELLEKKQFEETISDGDVDSYSRFVEIFPENRYVKDAQKFIYTTLTKDNDLKSFKNFVKNHKESPYLNEAWEKFYRLYISDYSKETILSFKEKHKDFPFPNMIETDLELVDQMLLPFIQNGSYGFMNANGEVLIPAEYEFVSSFSSGLAAVFKNDKFGFIDKNNKVVIDFKFDEVQDFEKGRAVVEIDGRFGWINTTGAYVLEPIYEDIGVFSNGIIYAFKEGKYQYFNRKGMPLFGKTFDEAYSFSDGLAKVFFDDYVAFMRTDGSFLIKSDASDLRHFYGDLFVINFGDSINIIDTNDSLYLEESLDRVGSLNYKRAIFEKDNEFGYLDEMANIVIEAKYNLYPNYFQFAQFSNHHAKVAKGDKFSLIDTSGNKILPAIFDNIGDFGELIPVNRGNGWGYADHNAKLKIRYNYEFAYPFINKRAIVIKEGLSGVINLEEEEIIPIQFVSIKRLTKGEGQNEVSFIIASDENREMLIFDLDGEQLTEKPFKRYHKFNENLLRLEYEDEISYFDIRNLKFISLID